MDHYDDGETESDEERARRQDVAKREREASVERARKQGWWATDERTAGQARRVIEVALTPSWPTWVDPEGLNPWSEWQEGWDGHAMIQRELLGPGQGEVILKSFPDLADYYEVATINKMLDCIWWNDNIKYSKASDFVFGNPLFLLSAYDTMAKDDLGESDVSNLVTSSSVFWKSNPNAEIALAEMNLPEYERYRNDFPQIQRLYIEKKYRDLFTRPTTDPDFFPGYDQKALPVDFFLKFTEFLFDQAPDEHKQFWSNVWDLVEENIKIYGNKETDLKAEFDRNVKSQYIVRTDAWKNTRRMNPFQHVIERFLLLMSDREFFHERYAFDSKSSKQRINLAFVLAFWPRYVLGSEDADFATEQGVFMNFIRKFEETFGLKRQPQIMEYVL